MRSSTKPSSTPTSGPHALTDDQIIERFLALSVERAGASREEM
jgi:hypothetical protein